MVTTEVVRRIFKGLEADNEANFFTRVADDLDWTSWARTRSRVTTKARRPSAHSEPPLDRGADELTEARDRVQDGSEIGLDLEPDRDGALVRDSPFQDPPAGAGY
jgi:hypothetical protein